jgi:uroporphyrinogen-III synthase
MNTPGISSLRRSSLSFPADASELLSPRSNDLALLHKTASRIADTTPLAEILGEVVAFMASVVKCDSCFVYVLEGDELVLRASKNPHPEAVDRLKMKIGQGLTGWVAKHRKPAAIFKGAYQDSRFQYFNELPEDRFEAFLSVPVLTRGRLVGVINTQNRAEYQYSEREISLIATIGFLAGAEIERARLETENLLLLGKLETRTVVERAKGILQRDLKITEDAAYRVIQRQSQEHRKPMKEIAEAVILSDGLRSSMSALASD